MDIRKQTCVIIRRGNEYLVGLNRICYCSGLKWSTSCYDAWRTRDRKAAEMVARKCGGDLMLFNPIAGQLREFEVKLG